MARLIAIVANWWNVFCRLADPTAHREAITSRPAYMGIMGRIVESGRKRIIHLTSTQKEICPEFHGRKMKHTYRPDLICYGKIVVELKATRSLLPQHFGQLRN